MNNGYNDSAYLAHHHPSLRRESAINLRAVAASMGAGFGVGGPMQMGMDMGMHGGFPPSMHENQNVGMGGEMNMNMNVNVNMNMNMMGGGPMDDASHDLPSWALETYYGVGEPSSSSTSTSSEDEAHQQQEHRPSSTQPSQGREDAFRFPADFFPGPTNAQHDAPSPAHSDASHGSGSSAGSSSVGGNGMHMPMMDLDSLPLRFASSTSSASPSPALTHASTNNSNCSNNTHAHPSDDNNSMPMPMITFHNPFASPYDALEFELDVPMSVGGGHGGDSSNGSNGLDDPLLGMGLQFSLGYEEYDLLDPSSQF